MGPDQLASTERRTDRRLEMSVDLGFGIWELNDSPVHGTIFRNFVTHPRNLRNDQVGSSAHLSN